MSTFRLLPLAVYLFFGAPVALRAEPAPKTVQKPAEKSAEKKVIDSVETGVDPVLLDKIFGAVRTELRKLSEEELQEAEARKAIPVFCRRLQPGESSIINFTNPEESPTSVPARYRLTRVSPGHFLVELALRFKKDKDYPENHTDAEVEKIYSDRISACFTEMNSQLKYGGMTMELQLSKDSAVPKHEIKIGAARIRSHSKKYKADIDCNTAIHEVMHVLGLVDEYNGAEALKFFYDEGAQVYMLHPLGDIGFTCRQKGLDRSIMYKQDTAAFNAKDMDLWEVEQCWCDPGVDCEAKFQEGDGKTCPAGTKLKVSEQQLLAGSTVALVSTPGFFVLRNGQHKFKSKTGSPRSLIYPAHFRAIVMPGCQEENRCYYACAQNAYRFEDPEPRAKETIRHVNQGCVPLPKDCDCLD